MVPSARALSAVLLILALLSGCGPGEEGVPDGGAWDAGSGDGGAPDGGDGGGGPLPAAALTQFSATAQGPTAVALSWVAGEGVVTGFELQRGLSSAGPFTQLTVQDSQQTRFVDEGLTTDTPYWYRARAMAASGPSEWSAVVSATPSQAASSAPPPPTNLNVLALSDSALALSWTLSDPLVTVEVERGGAVSGPFVRIFTTAAGALGFEDAGLPPHTSYWYRVRAVKAGLASDPTALASATTQQVGVPATPGGLSGAEESANSQSSVRLAWTDVAGETGYQIERSPDEITWTAMASLPEDVGAWVDFAPVVGTTQHYRVRAVNAGGVSGWAQVQVYASGVTVSYLCYPPTAVAASAVSETSIRLTWTYNSIANCSRVAVERASSAGGPYVEVARVNYWFVWPPPPLESGLFEDTGRTPGTESFYRLRSIGLSSDWTSWGYSPEVSAQTPNLLVPPTGLAAEVISSSTVEFSWNDPSSEETGFAVELASAAGGPFTELVRVPANSTRAHAQGFAPGSQSWVRVRTVKGSGVSSPSAAVAFTTASVLVLRASADASVLESTALPGTQNDTFSGSTNGVGCFYNWTHDLQGRIYLYHHCAGSALRFDTQPLAGRTVLAASLRMTPASLGSGPMGDAQYAVFALASAWNPSTVSFNTLPGRIVEGAWAIPAPTSGSHSVFNVTAIARKWADGSWGQHGLFVQQYPIVDRMPPNNADYQEQTTQYCSLEQSCGNADSVPTLIVEYF